MHDGIKRQSKKKLKVVIELLPKGGEFSDLIPRGEIIFTKDSNFDITQIEINLSGYFPTLVRLWPQGKAPNFKQTPNVLSSNSNSGCGSP